MVDYQKMLEERVEELQKRLSGYDLAMDLLASKVHIKRSELYRRIQPLWLCDYLERIGWKRRYEKTHERYKTRGYTSKKGDIKLKVHLEDLRPEGSRQSQIGSKIREAVEKIARVDNKGELQVIYEVLEPHETI